MRDRRTGRRWAAAALLAALQALAGAQCQNGPLGELSAERQANARANAASWGRELYPQRAVTATCVGRDSDGDSYVSCSVTVDGGAPIALECEYAAEGGSCKQAAQKAAPQ